TIGILQVGGKRYLSLRSAAEISGYHKDYLGQLIRKGEIKAERIGSAWFIEEKVFKHFLKNSKRADKIFRQHHQLKISSRINEVWQSHLFAIRRFALVLFLLQLSYAE
ncbi:MAG: hypothetical protein DRZ76_04340, partial [Candidatus Nealsonbacteria bacterium]